MAAVTLRDETHYAAWWGRVPYEAMWRRMQAYTAACDDASPDWLWCVEHDPVYTLGLAGRETHLTPAARASGTPVVRCDRGGQVTWHGPGQLVVYTLWDLRRRGLTVRALVALLEEAVIRLLADHGIRGERKPGAPGVYVDGAKIAALGLKVRHGRCYHGLSLNVANDLEPFARIDPCGYPGLAVTRTADWGWNPPLTAAAEALADYLPPGNWTWCAPPAI
ncbi:octanoyltransferase [Hydrogenophilus thermoluteolus]|nr:octanoyltransferase [Hydrogenophilus thermoluteolus]